MMVSCQFFWGGLYLLTFLSSETITSILYGNREAQEGGHEPVVLAYREILLSHLENLERALKNPASFCSPAGLEKEIFRIFSDCMEWIAYIRDTVTKQGNPEWTAAYQIMSVFFFPPLDDHLPIMLNCFCRITEANHMVHYCLSYNPDPRRVEACHAHAQFHINKANKACELANETVGNLSLIDPAFMAASYHKAMLNRRKQPPDPYVPWFEPLQVALRKIDFELKEKNKHVNSFSRGVGWWYAKLCKELEEGLQEQAEIEASAQLVSLSIS